VSQMLPKRRTAAGMERASPTPKTESWTAYYRRRCMDNASVVGSWFRIDRGSLIFCVVTSGTNGNILIVHWTLGCADDGLPSSVSTE